MNKALIMCGLLLGIVTVGCMTTSNNTNSQLVYNAGYTAALVWVSKAAPSDQVKSNIVDTVSFANAVVDNNMVIKSYSEFLTPYVNEYITKSDKFKAEDKLLVRVGSLYVLTCVDGLIAQVDTSKATSNIGYKYFTEFSRGFIDGLKICDSCNEEVSYILKNNKK